VSTYVQSKQDIVHTSCVPDLPPHGEVKVLHFLKRFWTLAVSLAGVVGLYLGALAVNLTKVFWIVLAVSVIVAGLPIAFKKIIDIGIRFRNYPALLLQSAKLQEEKEELATSLEESQKLTAKAWSRGLSEGRAQVLGSLLGIDVEIPKIVGIRSGQDDVLLIGQCTSDKMIRIGTRFVVESSFGDPRGIVEAIEQDEEKSLVFFKRIDNSAPIFWSHLQDRVQFDTSEPVGVQLAQYTLNKQLDEWQPDASEEIYDDFI